jgi:type VI protein secretion system component VasK
MDKAAKETDPKIATDAAKEAGLKLEMAAKKTEELAQSMPKLMSKDGDETSKALAKAQDEVDKARDSLRKNDLAKAQPAMKQAAQVMQQAAQEAGRQLATSQRQAGPPGNITRPRPSFGPKGQASAMPLQEVLGKFNGQSWGELPGEVKNRIVQDWQARYGADFAQVVRRYFEQLAVDSKK